ncbi:MAG: PilN domain-containing protein [Rhodanobacteraceae bacterium]|jgi:Tfp pilus assembly protein PilN|nr:PilN domain-containing protein [Rhodanobacteraceae bacterium]MBL0041181.1 PilN domain-containing protein [Xanthomonadales bacterium]MBP6077931.1 PilN domain-containing protein [Xanthomonadales bacterium]
MTAIPRSFLTALALGLAVAIAQAGEPAPADVVDALKQLAPAAVTVDRVEFVNGSDSRFQISGRADRNATVSNYLRALDTSDAFHKPELLQIMLDANGHPSFEIMLERKPEPEATTAAAGTSATTTPTPKKSTVYRCTIEGREVFQSLPCPAPTKR